MILFLGCPFDFITISLIFGLVGVTNNLLQKKQTQRKTWVELDLTKTYWKMVRPNLDALGHKAWVEDRLSKVDVSKVPGALRHVPSTCLTPGK